MTVFNITNPYQSAYCHYCDANRRITQGKAEPVKYYGLSAPYPQEVRAELECGHTANFVMSVKVIVDHVPAVRFA